MNERDDNMQQKQEQEEHELWWEKNRRLLNGFEELRPVIQGKKTYEEFQRSKNEQS